MVIPAYNAEATLAATLASVRDQSYRALEIIVVDDGSRDGTAAIARAHAAEDPRVRLVSIDNGGVAHARNAGILAARGAFVAPVDADDLWHRDKLALQMAAMRAGGPAMGFVYTFFVRIDGDGRILHRGPTWPYAGAVFLRHLVLNFVGNGSSLLVRRAALEDAGGYEPDLRRRGAEGGEDYLLQLLIARSWTVGLVPQYLTGYRATPGAMSTDAARLVRSHLLMLGHVRRRFPEAPGDVVVLAEAALLARLAIIRFLVSKEPVGAVRDLLRALRLSPGISLCVARHVALPRVRQKLRTLVEPLIPRREAGPRPPFLECDPADTPGPRPHPLNAWVQPLADREAAFAALRRRCAFLEGGDRMSARGAVAGWSLRDVEAGAVTGGPPSRRSLPHSRVSG